MLNTMIIVKIDDSDTCHFYCPNLVPKFESCCILMKISKLTIFIMPNPMVIFKINEFDTCHFY